MATDLLNTDADESWLHDLFDDTDDWAGYGDPVQQKYTALFGKAFNPAEPRDQRGQWTDGSGGMIAAPEALSSYAPSFVKRLTAKGERVGPSLEQLKNNMRPYLEAALAGPTAETDRSWYRRANVIAQGISAKYGVSMGAAVGVLAALSPQRPWSNGNVNDNLNAAGHVFQAIADNPLVTITAADAAKYNASGGKGLKKADIEETGPMTPGTVRLNSLSAVKGAVVLGSVRNPDGTKVYPALGVSGVTDVAKAILIAKGGDVEGLINSPKVSSFYNNISSPEVSDHATVDRWMLKAMLGKDEYTTTHGNRMTMQDWEALPAGSDEEKAYKKKLDPSAFYNAAVSGLKEHIANGSAYMYAAEAVRSLANEFHLKTPEAQAMIWSQVQGEWNSKGTGTPRRAPVARRRLGL